MRRLVIIVSMLLWLAPSGRAQVDLVVQPTFDRCREARFALTGPVRNYAEAVQANWLLRAPRENPAMIQMFVDRDKQPYRSLLPWSGEFAGKFLTSMTQALRLTGNERLKAAAEQLVRELVATQDEEDGYLGPFPKDNRLTGSAPNVDGGATWDAWGHYHAMLGLMLWNDDTNDSRALECARRMADLLCRKFPAEGPPISSIGSQEMNQAPAHSLALLYERTGEPRYLELAERIVEDFSSPGAGDYLKSGLRGVEFFKLPRPRWESLHPMMALAELYWITGDPDYRTAFENLWWSIARLDRHNNGGFSSGEQAQGNPYHPGAIETCCTIAWMAMSVEMLRMTGDSRVADELELSTLNQVIATFDPSGRWSTYNTPMDGRRAPNTVDIAFQIRPGSEELNCCSVNAARGFGLLADWAVMCDKQGLILNWYGPGRIEAPVDGVPVALVQRTDYPASGRVVLSVEPAKPTRFALRLRIPHWSAETKASVNGEPVVVQPGAYLTVDRLWTRGDKIELEFDMSLRYWAGEQQCAGKASFYWGPLLLAYEEPRPTKLDFSEKWKAAADLRVAERPGEFVAFTFEGDAVAWHGARYDDAGLARVAIDERDVEVVDQFGPRRGEPFVWRKKGLGPGAHVLRLEVLGDKSANSKGAWVNYYRFETPTVLPKFEAQRLAAATPKPLEGGIVAVDVLDSSEHEVRLRDFGTAGQNGVLYSSWLPIDGLSAAEFSPRNPSRTVHFAD